MQTSPRPTKMLADREGPIPARYNLHSHLKADWVEGAPDGSRLMVGVRGKGTRTKGDVMTTVVEVSWPNNASVLQSAVIVSQNGIVAHSFRTDEVFTPYGVGRRGQSAHRP